jgi:enoyl-CoA hydratase/carnithine racemase
MTTDNELVLIDVAADGVATITLNDPEQRNGWSAAMESRYFDVLSAADADPTVRAGVLTGAGASFCPGLAIGRLGSIAEQKLDLSGRRPQYTPRLFRKPLIGAINGACAGIGLVQALQCDVRFAAAGAKFSTAFARRGLGAEYNMSWVLPRLIGVENAMDLLLSGRTFVAEEAQRLGLVSRVVAAEVVLSSAQEYARDIARNCSPTAVAVIKHQVLADLDVGFEDGMLRSARVMAALNGGADMAEGVASFVERRPPAFSPLAEDFDPETITSTATPGARLTVPELLAR